MTRLVVLVRGINVGKHNRISMADLRQALTDSGATDVTTYLQSGNAVVTAEPEGFEARVEHQLRESAGMSVRVLTRTADDLRRIVAENPFPEKVTEPKLLHVVFCEHPFEPGLLDELGRRHGADEMAPGDRAVYVSYAERSYDAPINAVLPRLPGSTTARNWTTVTKLAELADR